MDKYSSGHDHIDERPRDFAGVADVVHANMCAPVATTAVGDIRHMCADAGTASVVPGWVRMLERRFVQMNSE